MRNPGTEGRYFITIDVHTFFIFFYIKNYGVNPADKPSSDKLQQKNPFLLGQAPHHLPEPLQKKVQIDKPMRSQTNSGTDRIR